MAETDVRVPSWLKSLPLAPEYRPTETEFADPIAFISRIEQEAANFGICKVIPPLPKPSKKFVFANINRSLAKSPELVLEQKSRGNDVGVFTTRHQELGSRRVRNAIHKQVWQSGEVYTLEQFEAKSKAFAKSQLRSGRDVTSLVVESLFWKATAEKPIYIEYANDVPGSGFGTPEGMLRRNFSCQSRRKRTFDRGRYNSAGSLTSVSCEELRRVTVDRLPDDSCPSNGEMEGSAGWKLSNSPWNLQVIARAPGSLTRFMPDEVPGVTSPMVYIGMLFSWFAWHVEDHELHSLNFLHTGSPKTWYAVPGGYASKLEDIVHSEGYGYNVDRLAAFIMLGEKRTLFSPEVLVAAGIPCCRLVQNPGEFVVTFPRSYHVGFSHGFNCGEAANFATAKWLSVAKEAAVRRAAMSYLPMLSHQQLLYMLAVSFISRIPAALLPGARSSRLRDRRKEEREDMVKRAFFDDITNEHVILDNLLRKSSAIYTVYWDPGMLTMSSTSEGEHSSASLNSSCVQPEFLSPNGAIESEFNEHVAIVEKADKETFIEKQEEQCADGEVDSSIYAADNDELPCGLNVDSGTLVCVACGILGYPFMSIIQPLEREELCTANVAVDKKVEKSMPRKPFVCSSPNSTKKPNPAIECAKVDSDHLLKKNMIGKSSSSFMVDQSGSFSDDLCSRKHQEVMTSDSTVGQLTLPAEQKIIGSIVGSNHRDCLNMAKEFRESVQDVNLQDYLDNGSILVRADAETRKVLNAAVEHADSPAGSDYIHMMWNTSDPLLRPRSFCLQHAIEMHELLKCKGGSNVLVICHSDYLKIKSQAMAAAENVSLPIKNKDIVIGTASKRDLELISLSINGEEYKELEDDWTSKMGVNLRRCIRLWKHTPSKQERLSLALTGLFSGGLPLSIGSSLRWHSRKSRTMCKLRHCRFPDGLTKGKVSTSQTTASAKDQTNRIPACESSGTKIPCKLYGQPKNELHREFLNGTNGAIVDNKEDIDKAEGSLGCLAVDTEPRNKMIGPGTPSGNSGTCAVSFSLLEKEGSVSSDKVSFEMSHDFPIFSTSGIENHGQTEDQPVGPDNTANVSDSMAEISESAEEWSEMLHDVRENALSDHISQDQDGTILDIAKTEQRLLSSDTNTNFPKMTASLGILHDAQLDSKIKANISSNNQNLCIPSFSGSSKCEAHRVISSETARQTAEVLHVSSGVPKNDLIAICNADAVFKKPVDSPIKCYKRRRNSGKATLVSTAADTMQPSSSPGYPVSQACGTQISPSTVAGAHTGGDNNYLQRDDGDAKIADITSSGKCDNKRKREIDQLKVDLLDINVFVRSPCEGLRTRRGRMSYSMHEDDGEEKSYDIIVPKKSKIASSRNKKHKDDEAHICGLEGCRMRFQTKEELALHRSNRCTHEGCGKRFSKHRYAIRHQRVHTDERPLKCPWKGCTMSFKWTWARTEHLRVHTGERPYKCKVAGCGLTFRFVSDYSRHRRKTGHYVSTPT